MVRRAVAVAGILGALGLIASACGAGDGTIIRSRDSIVLVGAKGAGDDMAGTGFVGEVEMVGDCLGVSDTTVFWPHGTTVVDDEPLTIDVPGLGRIGVGDQVSGGADAYVDYLPSGIDAIPSGCPTTSVIGFFPDK